MRMDWRCAELCGILLPVAQQGPRSKNYSPEARKRLGKVVGQARRAAGHRARWSFADEAGISTRSVEAVERGEDTVGVAVFEAVGRTLGLHLRGWNADTPESILNGGPAPELDLIDSEKPAQAHLDVVWTKALADFTVLFDSNADVHAHQRKVDHWRPRFHKAKLTDTDLLTVIKQAQKAARDGAS